MYSTSPVTIVEIAENVNIRSWLLYTPKYEISFPSGNVNTTLPMTVEVNTKPICA